MAKRNTEGASRRPVTAVGALLRWIFRLGGWALYVPVVLFGWLLAVTTLATLLWLTVGLDEGLRVPALLFLYVLRTVLGSLLLGLLMIPTAYVLPRRWREKATKLTNRQVVIAIVMCMALVAIPVALAAVGALR